MGKKKTHDEYVTDLFNKNSNIEVLDLMTFSMEAGVLNVTHHGKTKTRRNKVYGIYN